MENLPYKGYLIHPTPQQLTNSGEWTLEFYIAKHCEDSITERKFSADDIIKTKQEAIEHCINFGKQVIDGKIENCTITDL